MNQKNISRYVNLTGSIRFYSAGLLLCVVIISYVYSNNAMATADETS